MGREAQILPYASPYPQIGAEVALAPLASRRAEVNVVVVLWKAVAVVAHARSSILMMLPA